MYYAILSSKIKIIQLKSQPFGVYFKTRQKPTKYRFALILRFDVVSIDPYY